MNDQRPQVLAQKRFLEHRDSMISLDLRSRFEYIYQQNLWGSDESRSGLGSTSIETETLRKCIPELIQSLGIHSVLDIPCGDFAWLSQVDLGVSYTGADIVESLVTTNNQKYGSDSRRFVLLDLTADTLPQSDLILCRDCLVHFSYSNIQRALRNIKKSGSKYLLTTNFLEVATNRDIEDGDWRPLNFQQAPFHFPAPSHVIVENCIECDGAFRDKTLSLWRVEEIPESEC